MTLLSVFQSLPNGSPLLTKKKHATKGISSTYLHPIHWTSLARDATSQRWPKGNNPRHRRHSARIAQNLYHLKGDCTENFNTRRGFLSGNIYIYRCIHIFCRLSLEGQFKTLSNQRNTQNNSYLPFSNTSSNTSNVA